MDDSQELELVRSVWEATTRGDLSTLESALAEDARWRTVWEGPTNCEGRSTIVETIGRNLAGVRGSIDEMVQAGSRVIVGFRSERPPDAADRPLDNGLAYMVVTIAGGKITELKGCVDRASAIRYAETGEAVGVSLTSGPQAPDAVLEPPEQRVSGLVPFVRVKDVERSVAFYHHLGFTPRSVYKYRDHLAWASLESEGAEIMFEGGSDPVAPDREGVLFYLYSNDLPALREQLLAAGLEAGEIEDGSPGPSEQMRVVDPDGFVLMIAQND
jgi:ketosteroid isomerase-like protein/catechol 2,3-dioxygenase-like lactoylglutathione lyase family enzyme